MRHLLYAAAVLLAVTACDREAENPGDFSLRPTLSVTSVHTLHHPEEVELKILCEKDTNYQTFSIDDETEDTLWYSTGTHGHYVEMEPITLSPEADTLYIKLQSNARWQAPMPDAGGKAQWFTTQRLSGGGNSTVIATVTRNRNYRRPVSAVQYILTSDSTVMYKLTFDQQGEKD